MRLAAAVLAAFVVLPSSVSAWGFEAHKFIVDRAIDPDIWRTVGWEEEPPNHFLDMDFAAFGPYPFEALPRDYDKAVQKFGKDVIHTQGLLPWRAQEFYEIGRAS